jgi:hypothetical protein
MSETNLTNDPAIDEVRDARRRISERFDHDPARLVSYYIKLQHEQYKDRLISSAESPRSSGKSAA